MKISRQAHLRIRRLIILSGFIPAFLILTACQSAPDYPGYTLISKRFIKEVNADCYYFEHDKSGAKVFKIAAEDSNKTFSIAFKTIPESDCGTPHILEHSVLEGSRNFPVRSPFDELYKSSLQTFMNAFTASDFTTYPAASMNIKDYFNLMHVYFDAVFYPLIYEKPQIFQQEGWHYELLDPNDPLEYKGVVYNEMKGAYSNPERELYHQSSKNLFPDNCYGYSSGGKPEAILELTYEQFINFHRKFYHPSNSYIFLYGDADLADELSFIDSAYLSNFDATGKIYKIPMQEPFQEMKEIVKPYSVPANSETKDQAYIDLSFVIGDGTDTELAMALRVLTEVLVNQESAPLRLALQEEGIGHDITASANVERQQSFSMTVKNTNLEDMDRFKEVVFKTLHKVAEEGLDKEAIEGSINRMEFRLREGNDSQKGFTCNMRNLPNWMYEGDPFKGLEYEEAISGIKKALYSDYLEQIITKGMINNPHALLLVLEPTPGLENEIIKKSEKKLEDHKAQLSEQEIAALIQSTEDLIALQDAPDSPEALATIPVLNLEDINPEADWYEVEEKITAGHKILFFDVFTNSILYTDFIFDLRAVIPEMIPYVSILKELLGKLDTKNYPYADLEKAININTGGFRPGLVTYLDRKKDDQLIPKFTLGVKTVNDKSDKLVELTEEILLRTDYSDTARIRNLLTKHLARIEASVKGDGYRYALTRLRSYHSSAGKFSETSGGLEYYWFLQDLMNDYENRANDVVQKLSLISSKVFSKSNLILGVTCSSDDYPVLEERLITMTDKITDSNGSIDDWNLIPEIKNEGFMTASKVQYVVQGTNYKKLGYDYTGHMMVLNNVISMDWLHKQIRVKGGAYGGFGSFGTTGEVMFGSYRDPNLSNTLQVFAGTPEFVGKLVADKTEMDKYIIGTISNLDYPITPSQKGTRALSRYFSNYTAIENQHIRDEVLSTTLEDIHALEPLVSDVINQNTYCVYGNQEIVEANKELFHSVSTIIER